MGQLFLKVWKVQHNIYSTKMKLGSLVLTKKVVEPKGQGFNV